MSTPQTTFYSWAQVSAIFANILLDGYQKDAGIKIEIKPTYKTVVGSDGKAARCQVFDQSATITATLMASSAANDKLMVIHALGRVKPESYNSDFPGGSGDVAPFAITDNSGRTKLTAPLAWISKAPDIDLMDDVTPRVWVFETGQLIYHVGGN